MASLRREAVWPRKLEKQESQSHVLAVPTRTVSREEGVGQISLTTKSCWLPHVERSSCDSSESCVTTHWNHLPMWCHVTGLQGGQQHDQWPAETAHILRSSDSDIKFYSPHICQTLILVSDNDVLIFFQFPEKAVCCKFIFINLALFHNKIKALLYNGSLNLDAFELWCWRRLLRVHWTASRSNQSILKEISPECSSEGLILKLKLQYFGHLMRRADSLEKTLMLGKIEGRRRRGR